MRPFDTLRATGIWVRLICWLSLMALATAAQAQTFPKLTGRVVDDAHLLNAQQVAELTQLSQSIEQASSRQLVIATIPDLQGYPIEDYGYRLGRAWAIGQKDIDNGIILIVAPKEKKVRIEVGYGLEPIMTDALSSMIIQNTILPKFRAGDMAGGVIAGAEAIAQQLKAPPDEAEQRVAAAAANQRQAAHDGGGVPWALIFWLIVIGVVMASRFSGRRYGRRHSSIWPIFLWGPGIGGGSGWGGGGGFSGGGGGFSGFSGGGGSFGGGGASGGW